MYKLDEKILELVDYSFLKLYGTKNIPTSPIDIGLFDYDIVVPSYPDRIYKYIPHTIILDENNVISLSDNYITLKERYDDVFGFNKRKGMSILKYILFKFEDNYILIQATVGSLYIMTINSETSIKYDKDELLNSSHMIININKEEFKALINLTEEFKEFHKSSYSLARYIIEVNKINVDDLLSNINLSESNIAFRNISLVKDTPENLLRLSMGSRTDLFAPTEFYDFLLDDDIKDKFKTHVMLEMTI